MRSLYTIVGMQHRPGAQEIVSRARHGDAASLVRDAFNEHDQYAVEVWINNHHVGFVKGTECRAIADHMDRLKMDNMPAKFVVDGSRWPHVEVEQ